MTTASKRPLKLFYCYAREDKALRDELDIHLSSLKRQNLVTSWYDGEIGPGTEWGKEIDTHLRNADIILLLVTPHFMASDYCYDIEMKHALERHQAETARVIPIILRRTFWKDAPFSSLQVLPTDAKPVTQWPDRDEAYYNINDHIRKAINELQEQIDEDKFLNKIKPHEALQDNLMTTLDIYQGFIQGNSINATENEEMKHMRRSKSAKHNILEQESDQFKHINQQKSEHDLLLLYLPDKQRLDFLLQKKSSRQQKEFFLHRFAIMIAEMHRKYLVPTTQSDDLGNPWGSHDQLLRKLEHNLNLFDLIRLYNLTLYEQYSNLKADLRNFMKQQTMIDAFNTRQCDFVRQCHGNLRIRNIWIKTINQGNDPSYSVQILDAFDFNEFYRNIDVLADLAIVVVDVEAIGDEDLVQVQATFWGMTR